MCLQVAHCQKVVLKSAARSSTAVSNNAGAPAQVSCKAQEHLEQASFASPLLCWCWCSMQLPCTCCSDVVRCGPHLAACPAVLQVSLQHKMLDILCCRRDCMTRMRACWPQQSQATRHVCSHLGSTACPAAGLMSAAQLVFLQLQMHSSCTSLTTAALCRC